MDIFNIETREEYLKNIDYIDIDIWNDDQENALIIALKNQNYEKAKWLIEEGIEINIDDEFLDDKSDALESTMLYLLLTKDQPELQNMLIESDLKIKPSSLFKSHEMYLTPLASNVDILKLLIKIGHPLYNNKNEYLINNIKKDIEIWNYLFKEKSISINTVDNKGENLLFNEEDENRINYLINKGIDVNMKNNNLRTSLFGSSLEKTKILIKQGVNINDIDIYGKNALSYVKNKDVAKFLIDNDIDTNVKDLFDTVFFKGENNELYLFVKSYIEKKEIENKVYSEISVEKNNLKRL